LAILLDVTTMSTSIFARYDELFALAKAHLAGRVRGDGKPQPIHAIITLTDARGLPFEFPIFFQCRRLVLYALCYLQMFKFHSGEIFLQMAIRKWETRSDEQKRETTETAYVEVDTLVRLMENTKRLVQQGEHKDISSQSRC
jgi:hypothetical protein